METTGILKLLYCGENYNVSQQCYSIKFIQTKDEEPYFEFQFTFSGSPTNENVKFNYSCVERVGFLMQPYGIQFIKLEKNKFILLFDMIEELEGTAEMFKAVAVFNCEIPGFYPNQIIYDFLD